MKNRNLSFSLLASAYAVGHFYNAAQICQNQSEEDYITEELISALFHNDISPIIEEGISNSKEFSKNKYLSKLVEYIHDIKNYNYDDLSIFKMKLFNFIRYDGYNTSLSLEYLAYSLNPDKNIEQVRADFNKKFLDLTSEPA